MTEKTFEYVCGQAELAKKTVLDMQQVLEKHLTETLQQVPLESILESLPHPSTLSFSGVMGWGYDKFGDNYIYKTTFTLAPLRVVLELVNGSTHLHIKYSPYERDIKTTLLTHERREGPLQKLYQDLEVRRVQRAQEIKRRLEEK